MPLSVRSATHTPTKKNTNDAHTLNGKDFLFVPVPNTQYIPKRKRQRSLELEPDRLVIVFGFGFGFG